MRIEPLDMKPDDFSRSLNYYKLRFHDTRTELNFQKYLKSSKVTSKLRIGNPLVFFLHFSLITLYFASYLLKLQDSFILNSLKFQLVTILFTCLVSAASFILIHKKKSKISAYFPISSYLVFAVSLILNDFDFQQILFDRNDRPSLPALPGLVFLSFLLNFYCLSGFFILFWSNLVVLFLFGAVRISGTQGLKVGILEFLLLILALCAQQLRVYHEEFELRRAFFDGSCLKVEETEKNDYLNEEISMKLKNCADDLNNLLPHVDSSIRKEIESTVQFLSIISDYRTRNNTDFNMEFITKGLDDDDRLYIEQSWTNFQVVNIRKREKVKNKETDKVVDKGVNQDLLLLLKQIGFNWNLDMFDFNTRSDSLPIPSVGIHAFRMFNLQKTFRIEGQKLQCFLMELQKGYKLNPYHNAVHAADILSSGLYIVSTSFVQPNLTDLEMLALIVSHLAHDVGHPGFTNRFLVNFQDELAIKCNLHLDNDISVLENMHSSLTFNLLRDQDSNFLSNLDPDQFLLTRKWIIEFILATDMGKHFELLRVFKSNNYNKSHFDLQEIRLESLRILIKASDIGHSAKRPDIHRNWSLLISEEFFRQGDIEKESGKPVSMYCDRETTYIPKSQIGFLKNIALPLYEALGSFLQSDHFTKNCLEQVRRNIQVWENECKVERRTTLKETAPKSLLLDENLPLFHQKSEKIETYKSK